MPKKEPLRKCVVCGERKPKQELLRVVRTPEGTLTMDDTGKMNGRGAYLCRSLECIENAQSEYGYKPLHTKMIICATKLLAF